MATFKPPSNSVYKFPLAMDRGWQRVEMPDGARVVHVHEQDGRACLWASVNATRPVVVRHFGVFATGEEIPTGAYVGTIHLGWTVWHIFENRCGD